METRKLIAVFYYMSSASDTHDMGTWSYIINHCHNYISGKKLTVGYHTSTCNSTLNKRVGDTKTIKHWYFSDFYEFY